MSRSATPVPRTAARIAAIVAAASLLASATVSREMATPSRSSARSGSTATRPVPETTMVPVWLGSVMGHLGLRGGGPS